MRPPARAACAVIAVAAGIQGVAAAAHPGRNGIIVYQWEAEDWTSLPVGEGRDLWAMRPDGSAKTPLFEMPGREKHPAVSPNGRFLAFAGDRSGQFDLYVMELPGGAPRRVTSLVGDESEPTWSPDGRTLAFLHDRGPWNLIRTIGSDGTGLGTVTSLGSRGSGLSWSPDGRRFAYTRPISADEGELFTVRVDGTGTRIVTENIGGFAFFPDWSPDGRQLAYTRLEGCANLANGYSMCEVDISITDSEGREYTSVTNTAGVQEWKAEWSPDGEWLVYSGADLEYISADVYKVRPDGSEVTLLTGDVSYSHDATWQPLP